MKLLRKLNSSRYNGSEKIQLVSLLVQLLHSHTFEQEMNFDKFIFNYGQKVGLRSQLSKALRTFLQNSFEDSLEVHDNLEVIRSFVEKLYEQQSDSGLDYPNNEMAKVCGFSIGESQKTRTLKMLGGAFVLMDVILAIYRFGDHRRNQQRIAVLVRWAYKSIYRLTWIDAFELKTFLLSNRLFMLITKTLLLQGLVFSLTEFQGVTTRYIGRLLRRILCYGPTPRGRILETIEIVEPMLRTAMSIDFDNNYELITNLLRPLRNCIVSSVVNRNQLCSVDGWANFLLDQLEKLIDEKKLRIINKFFSESKFYRSHNHDHFIFEHTALLRILMNQFSPDEMEKFVELCSTPKVCQVLVETLDNRLFHGISLKLAQQFMENRSFVEQLKECGMVPALMKWRFSIQDQQNVATLLRMIDNTLEILAEA